MQVIPFYKPSDLVHGLEKNEVCALEYVQAEQTTVCVTVKGGTTSKPFFFFFAHSKTSLMQNI